MGWVFALGLFAMRPVLIPSRGITATVMNDDEILGLGWNTRIY